MAEGNFENNTGGVSLSGPSQITSANISKKKRAAQGAEYTLLRDAYFGIGGFLDGSHLVKHPREKADKYNRRRQLAYYLNYMATAVNSHVDPVFRNEVKRDWKGPGSALFEKFVEDTDKAGTSIQTLAKRAALGSKLFGISFTVMDNAAEQPATKGEAIKNRALPYTYLLDPERVTNYSTDEYGRLVTFSYREPVDRKNAKSGDSDYNIRTWTTEGWQVTEKDGKKILETGTHNLGRVPVAIWPSRKLDPANLLPPSEFGSIARTNLAIYQICSWLTEILQNQAFSILIYPSREGTEIEIGTDNALGFPEDASHPPDFIAPPADPAKMLADQIDRLIKEIYRMANLLLVTGVQDQKSGVAKAWDFERTNQTLADFATNCEAAEKDLAELFALWTGDELEYAVEYPRDFAIVDVKEELANAQTAIDMELGTTFLTEVAKKVLAAYMPSMEPEVFDTIMEELKERGVDEMMSKTGSYDKSKANPAADMATLKRLGGVIVELLKAPGIDPAAKAAAEAALAAAGMAA